MYRFFSTLLYVCFVPFVFIALLFGLVRIQGKTRKYRINPNLYTPEARYRSIYKLINKLFYVMRISVKVNGYDQLSHAPVLYVVNHKSNIDPLVMIKILYEYKSGYYPGLEFLLIAKIELHKGLKGRILDLLDIVYIDRNDIRQQFRVYQAQLKAVKEQRKSVVLFVEGHRYFGDEFGTFKPGALRVGYDTLIPIAPTVIYGSSGRFMDHNKTNRNKDKCIYVKFLRQFNPHDYSTHHSNFLAEKLQYLMQNEYNEMKRKHDKKIPIFTD